MIGNYFSDSKATMSFKLTEGEAVEVASTPIGIVTSPYGAMEEGLRTAPHTGIDYAVPEGTELHAPVDGIVTAVRDYGDVNLGKAVFVKMEDGNQYVLGHLSEVKVEVGDMVETGDLIALSGNTGNSTGPHLHFGAYNEVGQPIDPGNIPFQAFADKEATVTIPVELIQGEPKGINEAGSFVGDKLEAGARFILEPVGDALGSFFQAVFVNGMHILPITFTALGLLCFILTMAFAHKKPYFLGLGCWALSAIVRVINVEMGI